MSENIGEAAFYQLNAKWSLLHLLEVGSSANNLFHGRNPISIDSFRVDFVRTINNLVDTRDKNRLEQEYKRSQDAEAGLDAIPEST